MKSALRIILITVAGVGTCAGTPQRSLAQAASPVPDSKTIEAEKLFALKVLPLLKDKCFGCHGDEPKKLRGGFDMRTRAAILQGGDSEEPGFVAGKPNASPIYKAIQWDGLKMPPKETDRLTKPQIDFVRQWIAAGAPWPDDKTLAKYQKQGWTEPENKDGVLVKTSGGQSDVWTNRRYALEDLWAFRPVQKIFPPARDGHPIDAFLRKKLAAAGLAPAPEADKRTLIRRATYDLTGLPPTPAEVDAFLADASPKAWEKLIDRLLASPHYGEQWGRHWLDVTRYADSSGYSNDWERSNAWRYRDYVVRAFNNDKPYNRFILEQIAGDELDPDNPEMLVAVGFLRMGPWEHTPMSQTKVSRQLWLDDVTNSVGEVFLSTPLRCCKCHDHKFDPFPTQDYYRFQAAFATTQLAERPTPFLAMENLAGFKEGKARLEQLLKWANEDAGRVQAKEEAAARAWCKERGIPYIARNSKEARSLPEGQKPPRDVGLDYADQGFLKVRLQDGRIWNRRLERYQPLAQSIYTGGEIVQNSMTLRMPSKPFEVKQTKVLPKSFVLAGGSIFSPKEEVQPGVLSAVPVLLRSPDPKAAPTKVPATMAGRRLGLARWIADADNPLTTRSIVNRVWQYHFGKGLAENANNFGKTGKRPTLPELLDWLAGRFVEEGWSIKQMHRLIMTSDAYRVSSQHPDLAKLRKADPNNELLAVFRPRRLSAEELRDGMLAVSGELTKELGGLPVYPEINLDVALQPRMLQFSLAPAYQPSRTVKERNRRSLYVHRSRGQSDPFFDVFNQPNPNDSCERRDASTVTPQAFTMLNSDTVGDRALAMALRLQKEAKTSTEQLERAFRLAFGRGITAEETKLLTGHLERMTDYHRKHPPKKVMPPTKVTRSLVEELSGEAFEYVERLDAYVNYEPHAKSWDVSAETRALADVCLMLLNANEFVYVY